MRELVIYPRAELDQLEAFSYLASQAPDAARRFLDAVEEALHSIARTPESGHRYLNARRAEDDWRYLRLTGFKKYFVFYRITGRASK